MISIPKAMPFYIALLTIVTFFIAIQPAEAKTIVRTGENISVAENQSIEGEFYSFGTIVNISGEVQGDAVMVGGGATINGVVNQDALVIAGNVDIHGPIGDDLRIVGGEVVIAEPVTGDVFVLGGTVSVLSTASIGGDLLIYGGDVEVAGSVGGDILGRMNTLRVDAPVAGNIDVTTAELTLGNQAVVTGSVSYVSDTLLNRSPDATVNGSVSRNDVVADSKSSVRSVFVPILIVIFSVLVWFLFSRETLEGVIAQSAQFETKNIVIGLVALLLTPFAILILCITLLGAVIGVALLSLFIFTIVLGFLATVVFIGHYCTKLLKQPIETLSFFTMGLGVIVTVLLLSIPVVGVLAVGIVFIIVYGSVLREFVLTKITI